MALSRTIDVYLDLPNELIATALSKYKKLSGEEDAVTREMFTAAVTTWVPLIHSIARALCLKKRPTKRRPRRIDRLIWEASLEDPVGDLSLSKAEVFRIALELMSLYGNNTDALERAINWAMFEGKRSAVNTVIDPHGKIQNSRVNKINSNRAVEASDLTEIRDKTALLEQKLVKGNNIFVMWTKDYTRYAAKAKVVRVNQKSVIVELLEQVTPHDQYRQGSRLNVPKTNNTTWTRNFRIDHLIADPTKMPIDQEREVV